MEVTYDEVQDSAYTTMLSTTVIVDGTTSRTEHSVTPTRNQSRQDGQSTTFKPTKTKTSYPIILDTVYPRVLFLTACIIYLTSAIINVNIGLLNISNFVYPRYERAVAEYQVHSTTLHTEGILYGRLDTLLSDQLGRGFMETHEHCLVRGLEKANYELLGLGFQYPDMRTQVMDWAMENCGRLQYTPQVVVQDPTTQQAVLTYWADLNYHSRRKLEKALGFMRQQASWIWARFLSTVSTANASVPTEQAPGCADVSEPNYYQQSLPEVPFGFTLYCETSQPCRLLYPSTSVPLDKVRISPKALAKLKRQSQELHTFYINIQRVMLAMVRIVLSLNLLSILFATFACLAFVQPGMRAIRADQKWKPEEKHTVISLGGLFCVELMNLMLAMYPKCIPYEELVVLIGLIALLCGAGMLVRFFIAPSSKLDNVFRFYGLIKELYLITQGWEKLEEDVNPKNLVQVDTQVEDTESKAMMDPLTDTEVDSSSPDHRQRNQSPKSHYRLASPITSFQEDIAADKKALREKLKTQKVLESDMESDIDTDIDTESESESDTEDTGFVDLAGGVTPQLSDVGSGWSMVDA